MDAVSNDKNHQIKRGKSTFDATQTENKKPERPRAISKPSTLKLGTQKSKSKEGNKLKGGKEVKKDDDVIEQWWPTFNFDGRNALKSRLCINLRFC